MTSVLATLVVFAVLGFRAKTIATECVKRNVKAVFEAMSSTQLPDLLINASDVESITLNEYEDWYRIQGQQLNIPGYNITACSLEDELKQ
ncbi:sodium-dependent neutral amino acid transporter B(0)AT2-like, partial [Sinocyclocheilus rhinocerous]